MDDRLGQMTIMGLGITVGVLAELAEDDPEVTEYVKPEFDIINAILRQHGLPEHEEPKLLPMLANRSGVDGFPYSLLHYLRRFYARRIAYPEQMPPPLAGGEKPALDHVLTRIDSARHHLLWHAVNEGYYIPIDFPAVLEDERIAGTYLGSSVRLLDELIVVAAPFRDRATQPPDKRCRCTRNC